MSQRNSLPIVNKIAVTRVSAAQLFDISPSTFDSLVKDGVFPYSIKHKVIRRWDASTLSANWQEFYERKMQSGDRDEDASNPFDEIVG